MRKFLFLVTALCSLTLAQNQFYDEGTQRVEASAGISRPVKLLWANPLEKGKFDNKPMQGSIAYSYTASNKWALVLKTTFTHTEKTITHPLYDIINGQVVVHPSELVNDTFFVAGGYFRQVQNSAYYSLGIRKAFNLFSSLAIYGEIGGGLLKYRNTTQDTLLLKNSHLISLDSALAAKSNDAVLKAKSYPADTLLPARVSASEKTITPAYYLGFGLDWSFAKHLSLGLSATHTFSFFNDVTLVKAGKKTVGSSNKPNMYSKLDMSLFVSYWF